MSVVVCLRGMEELWATVSPEGGGAVGGGFAFAGGRNNNIRFAGQKLPDLFFIDEIGRFSCIIKKAHYALYLE